MHFFKIFFLRSRLKSLNNDCSESLKMPNDVPMNEMRRNDDTMKTNAGTKKIIINSFQDHKIFLKLFKATSPAKLFYIFLLVILPAIAAVPAFTFFIFFYKILG